MSFTIRGGQIGQIQILINCSLDSAFGIIVSFYKEIIRFNQQTQQIANILIDSLLSSGAHREFDARLHALQLIAKQDEIFANALKEWCFGHFIPLPVEVA